MQTCKASKTWVVTHDLEFGNLLGRSVLDNVYNAWFWCDIMYLFTNRYYERAATPPLKGRAPAQVTSDSGEPTPGTEIFASMLESLISEGIIVLPSEVDNESGTSSKNYLWDIDYLKDDKRGDLFLKYIEHLQTLKLRGILIPEMVVERGASAGTYAMASAHTDTFVGMLELRLSNVLLHINKYLIPELVQYNFGLDAPPCTIETLTKIGDRKDLLSELLKEVIQSEAKVGSLDTARIVDIIALLRQLNIGVSARRDQPDYETKVQTEQDIQDRTVTVQEKGQVAAETAQTEQLKIAKIVANKPVPRPVVAGTARKPAAKKKLAMAIDALHEMLLEMSDEEE
jgi:hypothetical protein